MTPTISSPATLDDLMKVDGKAERIGGKIIHFTSTIRSPRFLYMSLPFTPIPVAITSAQGVRAVVVVGNNG